MTAAAANVKACCATAYASDAARWLLGERFHPGGAGLTSRLASALEVGARSLVADVACGIGASSIQAAQETGAHVIGIDLSADSVRRAREAAAAAGLAGRVRFVEGDAERLPLYDQSVDGALCECALCTFPDKPAATRELARVLRPGARLALSDVTARRDALPPELRTLEGWVACVGDARPLEELVELLEAPGLTVERTERHDGALAELLERIEARLRMAGLVGERLPLGDRVERGLELLDAARDAVASGAVGYASVIAWA